MYTKYQEKWENNVQISQLAGITDFSFPGFLQNCIKYNLDVSLITINCTICGLHLSKLVQETVARQPSQDAGPAGAYRRAQEEEEGEEEQKEEKEEKAQRQDYLN